MLFIHWNFNTKLLSLLPSTKMRHNGNAMEVGAKQRSSDIWWIILIIDINFRWKKKWRVCVELTTGNFSCEHFLFTLNIYLWWSFNGTRYVCMEWIQWSCAVNTPYVPRVFLSVSSFFCKRWWQYRMTMNLMIVSCISCYTHQRYGRWCIFFHSNDLC